MGVEYAHGLFVADLDWRPTWAIAREIAVTLASWSLCPPVPELFRVDTDGDAALPPAMAGELPANLMMVGRWVEDLRVVEAIVGPSAYGLDDRYIASTTVLLGVDFKVLTSQEHDFVVKTPPANGDDAVEVSYAYPIVGSNVYPASWSTTPPGVVAGRGRRSPPRGFTGVWRSGVIIDCHKDIPSFANDYRGLPARRLVNELSEAFGTELVELGWFY